MELLICMIYLYNYYTSQSCGKGPFSCCHWLGPIRLYCRPPPPRASWRTTWQCSGVQDDALIASDMTHMFDLIWRAGNLESRSHCWNLRREFWPLIAETARWRPCFGLFPPLPQETTCQASWWSMECPCHGQSVGHDEQCQPYSCW